MGIDGTTKIVGIFGAPVAHTASPAMHNAAFAALGLNWLYLPFHVEPSHLRAALDGIRCLGLAGVNLTVPHKVLALAMLDDVDDEVRRIGAVNTVSIADGRLRGHNTDAAGFSTAIQEEFGLSLRGTRVLILGAGGAARAIAVRCAGEGAAAIWIANRTPANAESIVRAVGDRAHVASLRSLPEADLVVNATSVGLHEGDSLGLPAKFFSARHCVFDTIYRPAETELLRTARQAGARVANGTGMLLHQGARAFEIWTGEKAPLSVMRDALQAAIEGNA